MLLKNRRRRFFYALRKYCCPPDNKKTGQQADRFFPYTPSVGMLLQNLFSGEFRVSFHTTFGNIHTGIFLLFGHTQTKQSFDDQPHHQ